MTYLNSLHYVLERMIDKHNLKGESFREMEVYDLDHLLRDEMKEYHEAYISQEATKKDVMDELADVAIVALLCIEWWLQ